MKKRLLSLLLVCVFCVGMLPAAVAETGEDGGFVQAEAAGTPVAALAAPQRETVVYNARGAGQEEAEPGEGAGVAFHPYVFEIGGDSSVKARVEMQPGLMKTGASNAGTGASKAGTKAAAGKRNEVTGNSTVIAPTPVIEGPPTLLSASVNGTQASVKFVSGIKYLAENANSCCFEILAYTTNATLKMDSSDPGDTSIVSGERLYMRAIITTPGGDTDKVSISVTNTTATVSVTDTLYFGSMPAAQPGEVLYIQVYEEAGGTTGPLSNVKKIRTPGGHLSPEELREYIPQNLQARELGFNDTCVNLGISWTEQTEVDTYGVATFLLVNATKVEMKCPVHKIVKDGPSSVRYTTDNGTSSFTSIPLDIMQEGETQVTSDGIAHGVKDGDTVVITLEALVGEFYQNTPAAVTTLVIDLGGGEPTVVELNSNNTVIRLTPERGVYTGAQNQPAVEVIFDQATLQQDRDYTVEYGENINAGSGSVTVIGTGKYSGNVTEIFEIDPFVMDDSNTVITLSNTTFIATGGELKPEVVSVTVEGRTLSRDDYDVTYSDNIQPGTAAVTVTGRGNYTGSAKTTFEITDGGDEPVIVEINANNTVIRLTPESANYTGKAIKPKAEVVCNGLVLNEGMDYKVKYTDNVNAGKGTVHVTGIGRYKGEATKSFTIKKVKNKIKSFTKSVKISQKKLAKKKQTFKTSIKLLEKTKVTYKLVSAKKGKKSFKSSFKINSAGKVTVKKGLKKGTYKLVVKLTVKAGKNCKKITAKKTIKVIVK